VSPRLRLNRLGSVLLLVALVEAGVLDWLLMRHVQGAVAASI
jgi:hypothetical protein